MLFIFRNDNFSLTNKSFNYLAKKNKKYKSSHLFDDKITKLKKVCYISNHFSQSIGFFVYEGTVIFTCLSGNEDKNEIFSESKFKK